MKKEIIINYHHHLQQQQAELSQQNERYVYSKSAFPTLRKAFVVFCCVLRGGERAIFLKKSFFSSSREATISES